MTCSIEEWDYLIQRQKENYQRWKDESKKLNACNDNN